MAKSDPAMLIFEKLFATQQLAALKRLLVVLFICFYLLGLVLILLPAGPLQSMFNFAFGRLWHGLGFWQQWELFAPDVQAGNSRVFACITYTDGLTELIDLPARSQASDGARYHEWKLKQLIQDLVPRMNIICPDVCKFLARKKMGQGRLPQLVSLYAEFHPIELPETGKISGFKKGTCRSFYVYQVTKEDLQ